MNMKRELTVREEVDMWERRGALIDWCCMVGIGFGGFLVVGVLFFKALPI